MNYFTPFVHVHHQQKEQHTTERASACSEASPFKTEINRLLSAAVVNQRFCNLLLKDPLRAIAVGFNGESFTFSEEEKSLLVGIEAATLQSFAEQLVALGDAPHKEDRWPANRPSHVPGSPTRTHRPARFHRNKLTVSLSS
ncbi:MAG: hypothetical protein KDD84_17870 [Caldilineaceae bacterium]|nr:hypothetical protein [Caldilineaceae bacterium]